MKFDVPDEFVKLVTETNETTTGSRAVSLMMWASENPSEAIRVSKEYYQLGYGAKSQFRRIAFWDVNHDVLYALEQAWKVHVKQHESRSWLSKTLAKIREGYTIKMANGVVCTTTKEDKRYVSEFAFQNVKVTLIRSGTNISDYIKSLEKGKVSLGYAYKLILDNQKYEGYSPKAETIVRAIETNCSPYILFLM